MATRKKTRPVRKARTTRKVRRPAKARRPARKAARRAQAVKPRARRPARKVARRAKPAKPGTRRPAAKSPAKRPARPPASRPGVPNAIGLRLMHLDFSSHAMDEVRRFYTELLGFTSFDFDPEARYLMVRTGPSSSLGFMPPIGGPPEQWRPPREPALYLFVENVDRAYARLAERGVEFEQTPMDTHWGHRVAILRDPEGRIVCLAHPFKQSR
jgi:predicted enzyme related to lactoylglutathione lyase